VAKRDNTKSGAGYAVGYGKPPSHSRFKPGASGNPNGRPKGSLNLATVLQKALRERVTITENGKRRKITKLEATMKQLTNKAATGDMRAMGQLISTTLSVERTVTEESVANEGLNKLDEKAMLSILKRFEEDARDENEE
jgi:hypothetical protein